MSILSVVHSHGGLLHMSEVRDPQCLTFCGRRVREEDRLTLRDIRPDLDYDFCGACLSVLLDKSAQELLVETLDVIRVCSECGVVSSMTWWKCCPRHTSEQGPDVVCQSCAERLHPGEYEYSKERG